MPPLHHISHYDVSLPRTISQAARHRCRTRHDVHLYSSIRASSRIDTRPTPPTTVPIEPMPSTSTFFIANRRILLWSACVVQPSCGGGESGRGGDGVRWRSGREKKGRNMYIYIVMVSHLRCNQAYSSFLVLPRVLEFHWVSFFWKHNVIIFMN